MTFMGSRRLNAGLLNSLRDTRSEEEKAAEAEDLLNLPGVKKSGGIFGSATARAAPSQDGSFWSGGDKFRARDGIAGVLAVLSDAFGNQAGMDMGAVKMLGGGRLSAMEQARKLQAEQQQIMAARQRAQAAGLGGPQADLMAHGDAKYSDLVTKPSVERTTDNAGNVWIKGPDGKWQLDFVDNTPKTYFNNGMQIDVPNTYAGRPVGTPAPGYEAQQPQLNVNGEMLTVPRLGQQMPTLQDIQAERERRRRQRGY